MLSQEVVSMDLKLFTVALGLGAVAGATTVLMLPRQSSARQLAQQAADKTRMAIDDMMDTDCHC